MASTEEETVSLSFERCDKQGGGNEYKYQRGVATYKMYVEHMKSTADDEDGPHIVKVVLKDGDQVLSEDRVICRCNKPYN